MSSYYRNNSALILNHRLLQLEPIRYKNHTVLCYKFRTSYMCCTWNLKVFIMCFKGQDLHLHPLHAIWGIWEDYHRRWAAELLSEILPRFHPTLRSVRNVQSFSLFLFSHLNCIVQYNFFFFYCPNLCTRAAVSSPAVCEVCNRRITDLLPKVMGF